MPDLTPMTRQEKFLNGDTDLEPITRREHFYAGRESELPEGHQEPETREEWFIKEYREAGDVTVEEITITENGTTTAPSGKAYSPVNVNVPLPQNAYLLKSVNTPTPIASFSDGEEMVMPSLKVAIEPQQEGSGDPSPTNVRPISGCTEEVISVREKNIALVDEETTQKPSYYDGSWSIGGLYGENGFIANKSNGDGGGGGFVLPIKSGSHVVTFEAEQGKATSETYRMIMLGYDSTYSRIGDTISSTASGESGKYSFAVSLVEGTAFAVVRIVPNSWVSGVTHTAWINKIQIELGTTATTYEPYAGTTYTIDLDGTRYGGEVDVVNGIITPAPCYASYNGEALTGEWISDRDKYEVGTTPTIGAQVVNIGASGTPVSILPTAIKSLRGVNNVFANTGDITDAEYFSKEV